jgi:membrane protease YdiL (CAAX protease family)
LIYFVFPQLKQGRSYASQYPFIVSIICIALLPAVYEELIFRKLILQFLRKRFPDLTAILLSSFVFSLCHMDILQGITAFIFGIFLGVVAIRTGSIILCIYAHLLNNLAFIIYSVFALRL